MYVCVRECVILSAHARVCVCKHTYKYIIKKHTRAAPLANHAGVASLRRSLPCIAQEDSLPLHHAGANKVGLEVVAALLQAYPDAASKPDKVRCEADMAGSFFCNFELRAVCSRVLQSMNIYMHSEPHTYMHVYIYTYVQNVLHMYKNRTVYICG